MSSWRRPSAEQPFRSTSMSQTFWSCCQKGSPRWRPWPSDFQRQWFRGLHEEDRSNQGCIPGSGWQHFNVPPAETFGIGGLQAAGTTMMLDVWCSPRNWKTGPLRHACRRRAVTRRDLPSTSVFGDRTSFRAKGLRPDARNRNFTSVFGDRTSFRAKGLRPDARNRNFTTVFGDPTSFRAKRLRPDARNRNFISVFGDRGSSRGQESTRARENVTMWGCEDVKNRRCEDEKVRRWEDVRMWGWEDVKMWKCLTDSHY